MRGAAARGRAWRSERSVRGAAARGRAWRSARKVVYSPAVQNFGPITSPDLDGWDNAALAVAGLLLAVICLTQQSSLTAH